MTSYFTFIRIGIVGAFLIAAYCRAAPVAKVSNGDARLLSHYREMLIGYQEVILSRKNIPEDLKEIVATESISMMFVYWHGVIKQEIIKRDLFCEKLFITKILPLVTKSPALMDPMGVSAELEKRKQGTYTMPPLIPGISERLYNDTKYYKICVEEFNHFLRGEKSESNTTGK